MLGDNLAQAMRGEDFDPIAVGVLNKSQALHGPIVGSLDEGNSELLESFTDGMNVGHGNADMTEALGFVVAMVVAAETRVALGAPIMSQFQQGALAEEPFHAIAGVPRALSFEGFLKAQKVE